MVEKNKEATAAGVEGRDGNSCKRDQRRNKRVRLWSWADQWKDCGFYSDGDEETIEYFERGGT